MKHCLILCAFLFFHLISKSQLLIGFYEDQLIEVIKKNEGNVTIGKSFIGENKVKVLRWTNLQRKTDNYVAFGPDGRSMLWGMTPFDDLGYNRIVNLYNKNFIILSDSSWRFFGGGKVFFIYSTYDRYTKRYTFYCQEDN